ncbi:MAG: hypothetical protein M3R07_02320 [Gemmatimonadota bacterium]|nr:hypothetical protein [Gemmatimonadota bacterium]
MTDELKFPTADERNDSLGEPLASLIREAYTPPDAVTLPDVYWAGLESRIMARVSEAAGKGWWGELVPWARIGLVAATAIFAVAGIVNKQMSEPDDQVAYEAVVQPEITSASDEPIAGQYVAGETDAAALSYYLSN